MGLRLCPGNATGYTKGCRCVDCTAGHTLAQRSWRARRRAAAGLPPVNTRRGRPRLAIESGPVMPCDEVRVAVEVGIARGWATSRIMAVVGVRYDQVCAVRRVMDGAA